METFGTRNILSFIPLFLVLFVLSYKLNFGLPSFKLIDNDRNLLNAHKECV